MDLSTSTCARCGAPVGLGARRCAACSADAILESRPRDPLSRYEPAPEPARTRDAGTNGWAIASLVLGVMAWFGFPVLGAIGAVVAGHRARRELARTGERGAGLATGGLVLGWAQLALVGLGAVVAAVVLLVLVLAAVR